MAGPALCETLSAWLTYCVMRVCMPTLASDVDDKGSFMDDPLSRGGQQSGGRI